MRANSSSANSQRSARTDSAVDLRRRNRAMRPCLEAIEPRQHLSAAAIAHSVLAAHHAAQTAEVAHPRVNPLVHYRVFVGTITRGRDAGTVLEGPLVVGYSGRIQVIGYFFPAQGGRILVFGTQTGGAIALRFNLPFGAAIEAVGSGTLQSVRGGLPDGLSLVGSGNLSGPAGNDSGHWETLLPSRVPTS
jgi:hypothetical protein